MARMSLLGPAYGPLCQPPVGKLLTAPNIRRTLLFFYSQLLDGEVDPSVVSVLT